MKRALSLLLCCLLLCAPMVCRAQDAQALLSYTLPEGAESAALAQASEWVAPSGLAPLYALMRTADSSCDVRLIRMKHGRALVSISMTALPVEGTPEELLALWPQIVEKLALQDPKVADRVGKASVQNRYGLQALHFDTELKTATKSNLVLSLSCDTFYLGRALMEIWVAAPAETTFLFNANALEEREDDLSDAKALLDSLHIDPPESTNTNG
ncbi:MAG: hypothetical protein RSC98_05875 [Clostridia bacterium]